VHTLLGAAAEQERTDQLLAPASAAR